MERERSQKYLSLLSEQFPTRRAAYTEIINLKAILSLPCGSSFLTLISVIVIISVLS